MALRAKAQLNEEFETFPRSLAGVHCDWTIGSLAHAGGIVAGYANRVWSSMSIC